MSGRPGRADVLVVGGGVVGACVALELARRGREVVLLERGLQVGGGATPGSAGYLVPSHAAPLASPAAVRHGLRWLLDSRSPLRIRPRPALAPWLARFLRASTPRAAARGTALLRGLSLESLELHAALAAEGLATTFERRGIMNVYETASGLAAGVAEAREHEAAGLAVEVLGAAEAAAREPALRGPVAGAILYPDEASCDPAAFTAAVAAAAAAAGARIELGAEALALTCERGRAAAVETTRGSFAAGRPCSRRGSGATAWRGRRASGCGSRAARGITSTSRAPTPSRAVPVFLQEAQRDDDAASRPLPPHRRSRPLRLRPAVDLRRLEAIARRRAPRCSAPRRWRRPRRCGAGSGRAPRTVCRSSGALARVDDLIVCTGHAMLGLTLAPVSAAIVADLLDGSDAVPGWSPRPGRASAAAKVTACAASSSRRSRRRSASGSAARRRRPGRPRRSPTSFRELGLEPRFQEFPFLRFDAEEPELWVEGERWPAGPCMYAHPGTCEGPVERLSDGHWAVGEGRLVRSIFGKGPIPFTARGVDGRPPRDAPDRVPVAGRRRTASRGHGGAPRRSRHVGRRHARPKRDRRDPRRLGRAGRRRRALRLRLARPRRGRQRDRRRGAVAGRRAVRRPDSCQRTIELVAFAAEEVGLVGARCYIADARERDALEAIVGMVNLDCIGHGDQLQLLCSPAALSIAPGSPSSGSAWRAATTSSPSSRRRRGPTTCRSSRRGFPRSASSTSPTRSTTCPRSRWRSSTSSAWRTRSSSPPT